MKKLKMIFKTITKIITRAVSIISILGFAYVWFKIKNKEFADAYFIKNSLLIVCICTAMLMAVFFVKRKFVRFGALTCTLFNYMQEFGDIVKIVNQYQDGSNSINYFINKNDFLTMYLSSILSFIILIFLTIISLSIINCIFNIIRNLFRKPANAASYTNLNTQKSKTNNYYEEDNNNYYGNNNCFWYLMNKYNKKEFCHTEQESIEHYSNEDNYDYSYSNYNDFDENNYDYNYSGYDTDYYNTNDFYSQDQDW